MDLFAWSLFVRFLDRHILEDDFLAPNARVRKRSHRRGLGAKDDIDRFGNIGNVKLHLKPLFSILGNDWRLSRYICEDVPVIIMP